MRVKPRSAFYLLLERTLLGLGALLLIAWTSIQLEARIYQNRQMKLLAESELTGDESGAVEAVDAVVPRSVIGQLEIPRLGLRAVVAEGTDAGNLLRAVGHLAGTALPGRPGNTVLAGHRDTYFRPLAGIAEDDTIRITTPRGRYAYRVVATRIVPPSRTELLQPSSSPMLTLVTCYPFRFIGRAPLRFIVQAEEIPPSL